MADDDTLMFLSAPHVAKMLRELPEDQFVHLSKKISRLEGLRPKFTRCEQVAALLGEEYSARDAFMLLAFLENIYRLRRKWEHEAEMAGGEEPEERLTPHLSHLLTRENAAANQEQIARIEKLTRKNALYERSRKNRWLSTAFLPNVIELATIVDLRPRYSTDRSQIREFIPSVMLEIATSGPDGTQPRHLFQVTPKGLADLHAAIHLAEKKLSAIYNDNNIRDRVYKDPTTNEPLSATNDPDSP
jgi:hypothetical protein